MGKAGRADKFCGLRHPDGGPEVEVPYGVSPPEWGSGLATEIAPAVLRYGFERASLTRAIGVAPRRVLEKVGLAFGGHVVDGGREEARYEIHPENLRGVSPTTRKWRPEGRGGRLSA